MKNVREILSIEQSGVQKPGPAVDQEAHQVTVVGMPLALSQQHTMVVSPQDANVAVVAVLAARWHMNLTGIAKAGKETFDKPCILE
ncbi:hypothetical protein NDU88_003697 [Pleurodeles waltl]|uniref:Uncharacterized protein n=1 Tax=Pleurodeles waltl TaxID=8319 RepID=A0AAV7MRB5_PLEWA|nr:hypothetical protein NDU88_003697 [Pleurodeles waltl]